MKHFILFTLLLSSTIGLAQLNTSLVGSITYPNTAGNDIWGYVAPDGTEYALMGLATGVSVVSLADPNNLVEVAFADGPSTTWRDIKTWGHHAYVINETDEGLLVMDLSMLPDSMPYYYWSPEIPEEGQLSTCHNLYIDESGYAYLAGCNLNAGGPLIIDVFSDPGKPIYVGKTEARYSHDVYARDNQLYSSDINDGIFSIIDVADKTNPQLLATQATPFTFTHNTWLSDDGTILFTTDERGDAPTAAYDISDLTNIRLLDEFRPPKSLNSGVIPHNVHVLNDYLIISHYTDGMVIVDATHPDNLVEVGYFDTFGGQDGGFNGCWGAYPYLPSGLLLASDMQGDLFVVEPTYTRACYLEGVVRDASTRAILPNVEVSITSEQGAYEKTNLLGRYKTGQAQAGVFAVTFEKFGYFPKTIEVDLINGEITELNVELEPTPRFAIAGQTLLAANDAPAANALIVLNSEEANYRIHSDENGNFSLADIVANDYTLYVGGWGYWLDTLSIDENIAGQDLIFRLEEGYRDEFEIDLGWEETYNGNAKLWRLMKPMEFSNDPFINNLASDVAFDLGEQCYRAANISLDEDDIYLSFSIGRLSSPPMDLRNYQAPVLSYYRWFYSDALIGGDDQLHISLSNGIEEITLETITQLDTTWHFSEYLLNEWDIELTDDMRIIFETGDSGDFSFLEVGIDYFEVRDDLIENVAETIAEATQLSIMPNPFQEAVAVEIQLPEQLQMADLKLYNVLGELMHTQSVRHAQRIYFGEQLPAGIYFLSAEMDGIPIITKKLMKQ